LQFVSVVVVVLAVILDNCCCIVDCCLLPWYASLDHNIAQIKADNDYAGILCHAQQIEALCEWGSWMWGVGSGRIGQYPSVLWWVEIAENFHRKVAPER
jgi:hypothetical protein